MCSIGLLASAASHCSCVPWSCFIQRSLNGISTHCHIFVLDIKPWIIAFRRSFSRQNRTNITDMASSSLQLLHVPSLSLFHNKILSIRSHKIFRMELYIISLQLWHLRDHRIIISCPVAARALRPPYPFSFLHQFIPELRPFASPLCLTESKLLWLFNSSGFEAFGLILHA